MDEARTADDTRIEVDPITLEVIRHAIVSVADQIDANITRTAFSPYIFEYKDYAVGIVDDQGRLVSQSSGGMPVFVADAVSVAVKDGLEIYGRDRLFEGDVIVCNYAGVMGQHLNNTVMYTPIYAGQPRQLVGFFAINVHWIDIGGSAIGSVSYKSTDIFMEGVQYRTIKLWSKGEPIEEVYRIIRYNTRFPKELLGDIEAQLGGCLLGRDLMASLIDKYGLATFRSAVETIWDQSEQAARDQISAIPDGRYEAEGFLDNDGVGTENIPIKVAVIVKGDRMTVDFSGVGKQVQGCINSGPFGGGRTSARVAFKYLMATDEPPNDGTFRPLDLVLPPGTILSAEPTAAMGLYSIPMPTVIDTIIKALEDVMPDRVTGAHFGSFSSVRFYGHDPATGKPFGANDSGHGGWGAAAGQDGAGPFRTMAHGDTRIIPVELQESLYPVRIESFSLREDSGGPGEFRGGMGFRKRYAILGPCKLWTNFDRVECPPWGVRGGGQGASGRVIIEKKGQPPEVRHKTEGAELDAGDFITVETGGGGGYGPPEARADDAIRRDLARGYVTPEAARTHYHVEIGPDGTLRRL